MSDKTTPVYGIPLKIKPRNYTLVKCAYKGCNITLPNDLKFCGLHRCISCTNQKLVTSEFCINCVNYKYRNE
jgi:hypothetical protein